MSVNGLTVKGGGGGGVTGKVGVLQENVSTTPTMVVLVTACLSWRRGLSCLGGRLQLLHHGRGAVELADGRGPR